MFFYELFRWIAIITCYPFQLLLFKRRTYYEDGSCKPNWRRGGKLIISNHFNFLDYLMSLFIVSPRKLNVIAGEDPFRSPLLRFGMRFFGVIEANRITKNMRFMDQGAEVIRQGKLLLIYPEGRNTPDGKIGPFKPSYIVIAHRADAPIIPIVTDGNYGLWRRAHVMIGKEIHLSDYFTTDRRTPSREDLSRTNELIRNKILELRQELEARKEADRKKSIPKKESVK